MREGKREEYQKQKGIKVRVKESSKVGVEG